MPAKINIHNLEVIEFGVGIDDQDGERYVLVPVDADVQATLREMVIKTRDAMNDIEGGPTEYDPSEKHAAKENLYLPLESEMAANLKQIHDAVNLAQDPSALIDPSAVFCYFARMRDKNGVRLTAIRRATAFKAMRKSHLLQLLSEALKLVKENIFKLDNDFDLLVEGAEVHILRPAGFESIGQLEQAIKNAVPKNVTALRKDLDFVSFDRIQQYGTKHSRAARALASIRKQRTRNIDKAKLKRACKDFGVQFDIKDDKIMVSEESIMSFLNVLDRRLYRIELVNDEPESFLAGSRKQFKKP